jgi:hypothetical protein
VSTVLRTNFTNGEIAPSLEGQVDLKKIYNSCLRMENFAGTVHGPAEFRQGSGFKAATKDHSARSLLIPFQFNNDQTYILEFGEAAGAGYLRVFHQGGAVLTTGGLVYEVASPYTSAHFDGLSWLQIKDVVILTHHQVAPHKLSRTGHAAWTFSTITFAPDTATPGSITCTVTNSDSSATINCTYSAAAVTEEYGEGLIVTSASVSRPLVLDSQLTDTTKTRRVAIEIARVEGAKSYVIYRNDGNADGYIGYVKQPASGNPTYTDRGIKDPDLSDSPLPERNPFAVAGDYPAVVSIFQNRTVWGNTLNDPGILHLSRTANYFDLRKHELTDPLDDDAIELHVTSTRRDGIVGLVPRRQLYVVTEGGVFVVGGGTSMSDVLTPSNAKASPEGTDGGMPAMPLMVGNAALFVHSARQSVMEMAYRYDSDSYPTNDMTMFAPHLGRESSFKQLALAQTPASLVFATRENGKLVGMIYERTQDVVGWYRITTQGEVESIAVIYDATERRDQLWACVKRTVGGQTRRFIEVFYPRFDGETAADGCFLDCSLTYDGRNTSAAALLSITGTAGYAIGAVVTLTASGHTPFTSESVGRIYSVQGYWQGSYDVEQERFRVKITGFSSSTVCTGQLLDVVPEEMQGFFSPNWALLANQVSGLDHLEGESVTICADGCPTPPEIVTDGTVSSRSPASVIHAGLPYTGILKTTRMEGGNPAGTTQQTKRQRITEVGVRFYKSIGGKVGPGDDSSKYEAIYPLPAGRLMGSPPHLFTGDKVVKMPTGWNRDGYIVVKQDQPLPCTVLLLAVKEQVIE